MTNPTQRVGLRQRSDRGIADAGWLLPVGCEKSSERDAEAEAAAKGGGVQPSRLNTKELRVPIGARLNSAAWSDFQEGKLVKAAEEVPIALSQHRLAGRGRDQSTDFGQSSAVLNAS